MPECLAGALACPPEDCGGIGGFQEFKKIINNPEHPEYKGYKEWFGDNYNPEHFDLEQINKSLSEDNYGIFEW